MAALCLPPYRDVLAEKDHGDHRLGSDPHPLDEVAIKIAKKHWVWRAVDQDGIVLDILVQSRRDKRAAKRLLRKLLKGNAGRAAS